MAVLFSIQTIVLAGNFSVDIFSCCISNRKGVLVRGASWIWVFFFTWTHFFLFSFTRPDHTNNSTIKMGNEYSCHQMGGCGGCQTMGCGGCQTMGCGQTYGCGQTMGCGQSMGCGGCQTMGCGQSYCQPMMLGCCNQGEPQLRTNCCDGGNPRHRIGYGTAQYGYSGMVTKIYTLSPFFSIHSSDPIISSILKSKYGLFWYGNKNTQIHFIFFCSSSSTISSILFFSSISLFLALITNKQILSNFYIHSCGHIISPLFLYMTTGQKILSISRFFRLILYCLLFFIYTLVLQQLL